MIETREALEALDEILTTPGIDGVFVGPSDLSIALNRGAVVDPHGADVEAALSRIVERAHAHGKFAGLFCCRRGPRQGGAGARLRLVLRVDRLDPVARGGAPRTGGGALTACDIISQAPRPPRRPHSRGQSAPVGGFPRRAPPARRRLRANRNKISPRSIGRRLHAIDPADGALIALERADWVETAARAPRSRASSPSRTRRRRRPSTASRMAAGACSSTAIASSAMPPTVVGALAALQSAFGRSIGALGGGALVRLRQRLGARLRERRPGGSVRRGEAHLRRPDSRLPASAFGGVARLARVARRRPRARLAARALQ